MAIQTRDELIKALGNNSSRVVLDKANIATQIAGGFTSLWRATGIPGQGAIPTAATLCTKALVGSIGFTNQTLPVTSYYAWQTVATSNAATNVEFHDRLAHLGGLNGTLNTAQAANVSLETLAVPADRLGDSNYSDTQWWLEWYTSTGSAAVTATVAVTYNDATSGNVSVAIPASTAASRMLPVTPAVAGKFIKAVTTVTLSATTNTAGNFGISVTRPRTAIGTNIANKTEAYDWALLGLPEIPNDSCLMMVMLCSTTSTGTVRGQGKIIHG